MSSSIVPGCIWICPASLRAKSLSQVAVMDCQTVRRIDVAQMDMTVLSICQWATCRWVQLNEYNFFLLYTYSSPASEYGNYNSIPILLSCSILNFYQTADIVVPLNPMDKRNITDSRNDMSPKSQNDHRYWCEKSIISVNMMEYRL